MKKLMTALWVVFYLTSAIAGIIYYPERGLFYWHNLSCILAAMAILGFMPMEFFYSIKLAIISFLMTFIPIFVSQYN